MPLSDLLIRHAVYKGTPSGDKYPGKLPYLHGTIFPKKHFL